MFKFKRNKRKEEENPIVMERLNWDAYTPKKDTDATEGDSPARCPVKILDGIAYVVYPVISKKYIPGNPATKGEETFFANEICNYVMGHSYVKEETKCAVTSQFHPFEGDNSSISVVIDGISYDSRTGKYYDRLCDEFSNIGWDYQEIAFLYIPFDTTEKLITDISKIKLFAYDAIDSQIGYGCKEQNLSRGYYELDLVDVTSKCVSSVTTKSVSKNIGIPGIARELNYRFNTSSDDEGGKVVQYIQVDLERLTEAINVSLTAWSNYYKEG